MLDTFFFFLFFRVLVIEGQNLRYCGIGTGYEDIIIDGNLDELKVCVDLIRVDNVHQTVAS